MKIMKYVHEFTQAFNLRTQNKDTALIFKGNVEGITILK